MSGKSPLIIRVRGDTTIVVFEPECNDVLQQFTRKSTVESFFHVAR